MEYYLNFEWSKKYNEPEFEILCGNIDTMLEILVKIYQEFRWGWCYLGIESDFLWIKNGNILLRHLIHILIFIFNLVERDSNQNMRKRKKEFVNFDGIHNLFSDSLSYLTIESINCFPFNLPVG